MSYFTMVRGPHPHPHSVWLYWGIFFALVFLTLVTVLQSRYDFGELTIILTLLIAGTKAILVMAFFMHLAFDNRFLAVVASTSLVFLTLFIVFSLADVATRADLDHVQANFLPRDEVVHKHEASGQEVLPLRPGLMEAKKEQLIFIGAGEH